MKSLAASPAGGARERQRDGIRVRAGPAWSTPDQAIGGAMQGPPSIVHERNIWADGDSVVVVLDRLDGLRDREAQLAELEAEGPASNPEELSRRSWLPPVDWSTSGRKCWSTWRWTCW